MAAVVIPPAGKQHDWAHLRLPEGWETVEASHWLSAQGPNGIEVDPKLSKRWHDRCQARDVRQAYQCSYQGNVTHDADTT